MSMLFYALIVVFLGLSIVWSILGLYDHADYCVLMAILFALFAFHSKEERS